MTSQPLFESIDPETYLTLARELASRSEISAKRTAGDRAYYAAFLVSRNLLKEKGYATPYGTTEDHKYITETLKRPDVLGSFGNEEFRLRNARNVVTYDTDTTTQQNARPLDWMINTSEKIIAQIKQLPSKRI